MASEPSGPKVACVDTSQWRGHIDANKVKGAGKVGLFPRTTSRTDLDPLWHETIDRALAAGLVGMARHRLYGSPSVGAQFDAFRKAAEAAVPGCQGLLISLDSEDDASWAQVTEFEQRTFDRWGVWLVGYYPCWWLPTVGNPSIRKSVTWWHSRYDTSPGALCGGRTSLAGQLWQYSDSGTCPGIAPPVDLNWFYGTRAQLEALAVGGSGGADPTPEQYLAEARRALVTTTGMTPAGGSLFSKANDIQGGVDRIEPAVAALPTAAQVAAAVLAQLTPTPPEESHA